MTSATNVDHLIEVPGVYDGWSIAVIREPNYAYVNRWAQDDNPLAAHPGFERRYRMAEEYIERSGVARGRRANVRW